MITSKWMASFWRNYVNMTSFWRNSDVSIPSCVQGDVYISQGIFLLTIAPEMWIMSLTSIYFSSQLLCKKRHTLKLAPCNQITQTVLYQTVICGPQYCDVTWIKASQIKGNSPVWTTSCSDWHHRKQQSTPSLASVREFHQSPVVSSHEGPVMLKTFTCYEILYNLWSFKRCCSSR